MATMTTVSSATMVKKLLKHSYRHAEFHYRCRWQLGFFHGILARKTHCPIINFWKFLRELLHYRVGLIHQSGPFELSKGMKSLVMAERDFHHKKIPNNFTFLDGFKCDIANQLQNLESRQKYSRVCQYFPRNSSFLDLGLQSTRLIRIFFE